MNSNSIAEIASLVGDPARASMLHALLDGRALTASELARIAGITPQIASGHLGQLTDAGLLTMERQGRHRYHQLASRHVAGLLESLMRIAAGPDASARRRVATGPRDPDMRLARTCYDHIAGQLGVAISDSMIRQGFIEFADDAGVVTAAGSRFLERMGVDVTPDTTPARSTRLLCRPCLDWSERRPHLAGRLGAALCRHCIGQGWVRRRPASRTLDITPAGDRALRDLFGFQRHAPTR